MLANNLSPNTTNSDNIPLPKTRHCSSANPPDDPDPVFSSDEILVPHSSSTPQTDAVPSLHLSRPGSGL